MNNCPFCNPNENDVANTIIEETDNFYIKPTIGSMVDGYLMIITKRHINAMAELNEIERNEYTTIIEKYRNLFKKIYNQYPIIFEHGTSIKNELSSSSVVHAHTHIVNHNYKNEKEILESLNFEKINRNSFIEFNKKSYINYINPNGDNYITYNFEPVKQIMRILICKDLNKEDKYNWREYRFDENIIKTIEKLKFG